MICCVVRASDPFAAGVRPTEPLTPAQEAKTFLLPDGFRIQLFAAEPQINKPMNMAFDTRGRLWVTSTLEYPFPAKPGRKGRDSVKVLEDTNGDGRADKVTTFADGLNIPIGVYPYRDGVIVWSIPNIWYLRDTSGDGRADKRVNLYGPLGYERDTHGMNSSFTRGFDGWLHITHGFNNHTTVRGRDGSEIKIRSGNTYRVQLDGSSVQQFTWGQVNPFGMCLDPRGNFYTADCHSSPIYQLIRDGYYPSFGKPHDGLGYAPRTILHSHGSTAICGILYYADTLWPEKYHDNIFVGNVMTSRINRDGITFRGSSPKGRELPDFIRSKDPWYRPVDLQLGPDGALYIADFYNRIIGHYEVSLNHTGRDRTRGRIWRVTYEGKTHPKLDLTTPAKAVAELASPNLTRRLLALNYLADTHGRSASLLLKKQLSNPKAAPFAAWALHRLSVFTDGELKSLAEADNSLSRIHALRILGDYPKWKPTHRSIVLGALKSKDPHVRRAAGEAMARHPDAVHVAPLAIIAQKTAIEDALQARGNNSPDDHLAHTLRISLRNQLRAPGAFVAVGKLPKERYRELFARIALGVVSEEAGDYLITQLPNLKNNLHPSVRHAALYASSKRLVVLPPFIEKQFAGKLDEQVSFFKAMQGGTRLRGGKLPASVRAWGIRLAPQLLVDASAKRQKAGAEIARDLKLGNLTPSLRKLVTNPSVDAATRTVAIGALGVTLNSDDLAPLAKVILGDQLEPALLREETVKVTAGHKAMQPILSEALAAAPASLQLKFARALAGQTAGATTLLDTIAKGKAAPTLLLDAQVKERLPVSLSARLAKLTQGVQLPKADLAKAIAGRLADFKTKGGDAARGLEVFKTTCAACHQKSGVGGSIGPQLDGISSRGVERVVEDILDPNRNVDLAFRYSIVKLKSGQTLLGLKRREEGQAVVFADLVGKETTISKTDIAKQTQTAQSLMPETMGAALPAKDFASLLKYLLAK